MVEPAYALLGVAAHQGFKQTVVALDAALHTKTLFPERLDYALDTGKGGPATVRCWLRVKRPTR